MSRPDAAPSFDELRSAPKVLLHDHLDGGMRPETIVDLAAGSGYRDLPADDPDSLRDWFAAASTSGSLPAYLATFEHTFGVLQSTEAIARAARENVEDLAADGVIYAESRFAPELHLRHGLRAGQALDAVLAGTREGVQTVKATGRDVDVRIIVCAMRDRGAFHDMATLMIQRRDPGVAGFDLGGPEAGNPAAQFRDRFHELRNAGVRLTIHAGEGDGVESVRQAAVECRAERLGHGVRVIDDIDGDALGPVARFVHDHQIVLETSPSSNVHTGAAASMADHPAPRLHRLGFAVTVNTDNRLMSQTTLSQEFDHLVRLHRLTWPEIAQMTAVAAAAAFLPPDERDDLHSRVTAWHRRLPGTAG
ncbi:adenosine deaminase [Dactylosporangium sp. CA-139066]|uniref:adenosine deaminase n=1 Tax=Dactylosporangium sp. CA-139066 TaxID=3239930 RepID=UPI003D8BBED8